MGGIAAAEADQRCADLHVGWRLQKNANLISLHASFTETELRSELQFNLIKSAFLSLAASPGAALRYKFIKRVTFVFLFLLGYPLLGGSSCCRQLQWHPFDRRRSDCETFHLFRPCTEFLCSQLNGPLEALMALLLPDNQAELDSVSQTLLEETPARPER